MSLVSAPLSPAEQASLQLIADTQYGELMGSVSFNRKLLGIVPPGIYRGFNFAIQGATTLRICPVGTGENNAVIERDGQVINVLGQNPIDVTIPRSQEVAVVIEAFSAHGVLTKQIDKNAAVEAAQIKVVPVVQVLGHQVTICTVNLPATGNLALAHISTATRKVGGLLNSLTKGQADTLYAKLTQLAGGKAGAQLVKKSGADQDFHWLDTASIADAKARATYIFEFYRNRYYALERFGLEPKQLTDLLTLARAGVATYQSPLGLETAPINTPRIDWDPKRGDCNGLLTEPVRQRLTTYPEDLTKSTNAGFSAVSASTLTTTATVTAHSRKSFAKEAAAIVVTAVWELAGSETADLILSVDNGVDTNAGRITFKLATGVLGVPQNLGSFSGCAVTAREVDGYWRVTMRVTTDATAMARLSLAVAAAGGLIHVRRQWVEAGGHETSAITEAPAGAAIRPSDAGLVNMPFQMTRFGTMFIWVRVNGADTASHSVSICSSKNDYIGLQYIALSGGYAGSTGITVGGSTFPSVVPGGDFKGQWVKILVTWGPNRLATFHNGKKLDHPDGASFPGFNRNLQYLLQFGGMLAPGFNRDAAAMNIREFWISAFESSDEVGLLATAN